ncbi:MAG TPA: hypothetical protein VKT21_06290 [Thermoplasmata archaeon]|nr:hypothetical protein [Thermoplasmata archaeon]
MSTATATYGPRSKVGELPILVGILAVLIGLFGLFLLVIGLLLLADGFGFLAFPAALAFSPVSGSAILAGAATLIFGVAFVAVASGLWNLDTWALWFTGIVLAGIIGILVLSHAFGIPVLIVAVLLVYLIAVRKHFY